MTGLTSLLMAWMTRERFLLSGKDLIGVQNLLKKHQALQAEIAGHEPRIKAVTQKGNAMVEEGERLSSGSGSVLSLFLCPFFGKVCGLKSYWAVGLSVFPVLFFFFLLYNLD